MDLPPLAVDVDGTLTREDKSLDPRVVDVLRAYAERAPVVVATGKSFAYPVAFCEFLGLPTRVVAENGGVVYVAPDDPTAPDPGGDARIVHEGDPEGAAAVREGFTARGHDLGWGPVDLVNYWRETELAVSRERPLDVLRACADEHDMVVVDTGYAYHVKAPDVDKGTGLSTAADRLDRAPRDFVAVGDSENDAEMFERVGEAYAVANADEHARAAADHVTDAAFADGFLEAVERVAGGSLPTDS